jgi:hypothetical protein
VRARGLVSGSRTAYGDGQPRRRHGEALDAVLADYQQWQLPGTLGTNAIDFEMVIASWRLVYKVENRDGGTFIDAYTGQTVQKWSNYID